MGKCSICKKKIEYNQFKRHRGKILCYACYDTRLERKAQKKKEAEEKLIKDAKEAEQKAVEFGLRPTIDEAKEATEQ